MSLDLSICQHIIENCSTLFVISLMKMYTCNKKKLIGENKSNQMGNGVLNRSHYLTSILLMLGASFFF